MSRWTWHGGGVAAARVHFGGQDWLDLSTGINPHAWPAHDIAIDWRRLPEEGDLRALEQAAARHFGVDADHVCAVPGTEIGLRLVGDLISGSGFYIEPSYRTHGEMLVAALPVARDDLAMADGTTLVLANPNNPDGHLFSQAELLDLVARRGAGWLAVDEAFADATPGHGIAGEVADGRRLVVFRSFGKFFGLAGLRLGFVVAPRGLLARLRAGLGAWPVSAAAIAIGTRAYADRAWIEDVRGRLAEEAAALDGVLAGHGFTPIGACPLFRLIETDAADALFERLARRAILTRPFIDEPRWLRLGLPGGAESLARLDAALGDG